MAKKRKIFKISFFILVVVLIILVVFYTSIIAKEKRVQTEIESFIKMKFNGCVVDYQDNKLKSVSGTPHTTIRKEEFEWIIDLYVCSQATATAFEGEYVLIIFR